MSDAPVLMPFEADDSDCRSVAYPTLAQLFSNSSTAYNRFIDKIKSNLPAYASQVASRNNNATSAADLLTPFEMQYDVLVKDRVPAAELIFYTSGSTLQSQYWTLLPFSRGSVHRTSASASPPSAAAAIDPQYFTFTLDVDSQALIGEFNHPVFHAHPLSKLTGVERSPRPPTTSASQSSDWTKKNFRPNYHVMSSASMLPRSKGGVVDPTGKVYGTDNVRVVDASIIPFQVCGHLTSTLYAVAERIADLMKEC